VASLPGAQAGVTGPAVRAQLAAERAAIGAPQPDRWREAAVAWEAVGRPYEAACAHVRAGEALLSARGRRTEALAELSAAWATACRLRAEPLKGEVAGLARAARLRLPAVDDAVAPVAAGHPDRPATAPRLTSTEEQVLALVAEGRTNREIGALLYMSPKTASVHVTHILQKFGVRTRVQAAAVAARRAPREPARTAPANGPRA